MKAIVYTSFIVASGRVERQKVLVRFKGIHWYASWTWSDATWVDANASGIFNERGAIAISPSDQSVIAADVHKVYRLMRTLRRKVRR